MRVLGHVRQREADVADREDAASLREHEVPTINFELMELAASASRTASQATKLAAWQLEAEHAERSARLLAESQKRAPSSPSLSPISPLPLVLAASSSAALSGH